MPVGIVFKAKEAGDNQYRLYFYDVNFHQIILSTDGMLGYPNFDITCSTGSYFLVGYTEADAEGYFDASIADAYGVEIRKFKHILKLGVSPDGKFAVIARRDSYVLVNITTKNSLYLAPFEPDSSFHWAQNNMYFAISHREQTHILDMRDRSIQEVPAYLPDWSYDSLFVSELQSGTLLVRQLDSPYALTLTRSGLTSVWSEKLPVVSFLELNKDGFSVKTANAVSGTRNTVYTSKNAISNLFWFEQKVNLYAVVQTNGLWLLDPSGTLEKVGRYRDIQNVCEV